MSSAVMSDRYVTPLQLMLSWHDSILEELASFEYLPADWDGEGAQKPSRLTIKAVESFVEFIKAFEEKAGGLVEPTLAATKKGGILLDWNVQNCRLDIEFYGPHEAQFVFLDRDKDLQQVKGKLARGRQIPSEFLKCLRSFLSSSLA